MASVFWLIVLGYLLVGLGELIPTGFRTDLTGRQAHIRVCLAALNYAFSWPLRYWRALRSEGL